jgi:membrane fusion protein (multidrug efflux system)
LPHRNDPDDGRTEDFIMHGTYKARFAALIAIALLCACTHKPAGPAAAAPVEVGVITVALRDVPVVFEYVGQTQSSQQVEIRARVSGFLDKRVYTEGATVHAGDLLFQMDRKPFEAALDAAKAEYNQQRARLATAQSDLDRVKPLAEKNALSQKDLDDAVGNQQAAAAALEQARANVTSAELNLGYTSIVSPVTGLSSFAKKQEGSYIDPSSSLLTYVAKLDPMWVNFSLSENELLEFRSLRQSGALKLPLIEDLAVEIVLADGSSYAERGHISFADASFNTETGTYLVRAEVPNRDGTLRPGQFVRVRLSGAERANAIAVPQQAVVQGDRGAFVWTVGPGDKAQQRVVETGDWSGNDWIINSGLHAGDRVVVENVMRVAPDAPLKAVAASVPAAPAAGSGGAQSAAASARAIPTRANPARSADAALAKTDAASDTNRGNVTKRAVVQFEHASAAITTEMAAALAPIVAEWHGMPNERAAISGYVDATGSKAANERLAQARAKAVRAALIVAGIPQDRIELRTPANIVAGETADARRVEISLIGAGERQ